MHTRIFSAARMTSAMINRKEALETLYEGVCKAEGDTRIIIIEGKGGLGKTRLLSEALWRAGHTKIFPHLNPPDENDSWNKQKKAVVSDLIDFSEVRLHTFLYFLERISQSFNHPEFITFPNFESAIKHYKQTIKNQADFSIVKKEAEEAREAFFDDYAKAAQEHHLVWALDTAEQLSLTSTPWLLEKKLLRPRDFNFSVQQQLLDALQSGKLPNTTLILVGRPEARFFFDQVKEAAINSSFAVETINLGPFTVEDVQSYLTQLSQDYKTAYPEDEDEIGEYLHELGTNENHARVFHLYTGGQPVRLALFMDVVMEGKQIPEALKDSFAEAKKRVEWNEALNQPNEQKLAEVQAQIEKAFINLLFLHTTSSYPQMLQALVRARRGLNEQEMALVLDYFNDEKIDPDIKAAFNSENNQSLRRFSFVKDGPEGRLILQDEMYRIYDQQMGNDPQGREDEAGGRKELYNRLLKIIEQKTDKLKEERRQQREEDERALRWETPARALSMTFRHLTDEEDEERIKLDEDILNAEIEHLHYQLRIDPDIGFNSVFDELTERYWLAGNQEAGARLQFELQKFISDKYLRAFVSPKNRPLAPPDDDTWQALERGVQQNEIVRWIKRFRNKGDFRRAVEFADEIENIIPQLDDEAMKSTLRHPFSVSERNSWREFNRIFLADNLPEVVNNLTEAINQIKRILKDGEFSGHPIKMRLYRAIGAAYNNLGYAQANSGDFWDAAEAYAESLKFLRDTRYWSQQATARNNLARVLAERGLITRAVRIAQDGLKIRRGRIGSEAQIAYSHNTLALIYNKGRNSEKAWPQAALAMLYFRELQNTRGLGMSLLQLSEALRRLAGDSSPLQIDPPEAIFDIALRAVSEAAEIFSEGKEVIRQIEADIELGCVYRDYLRYLQKQTPLSDRHKRRIEQYGNRAVAALKRASETAKGKFSLLEFDALDDLAWTYYYIERSKDKENNRQTQGDAQKVIDSILSRDDLIPRKIRFQKEEKPTWPHADESQVFALMGKIYTLQGRMAIERFKKRGEDIIAKYDDKEEGRKAVHNDPEATETLKEAAEAFVLALAYNRLYSPRAAIIANTLDDLYNGLTSFNKIAMEDFYRYQNEAYKAYWIENLVTIDPTNLDDFLQQSFGDYLETGFTRRLVSIHKDDDNQNGAV
ncbi:MAG: hypothetical protein B6I38_05900 [Anaerolineaceae bacterium 4572_5.1]|nr:MAG: hypothetical protein B6I38_05900 [Anaerolineaceae bacterium 4572_5.1]